MTDLTLVTSVIFFAVFTQTAAGFGIALVAMPLLTSLIGLEVAAPLIALIALMMRPALLLRYRHSFRLGHMWRLILASFLGVGLGSLLVVTINNNIVERLLGVVVIVYAVYSLINPHIEPIRSHIWAYLMGFISGFLARLYNIGGPPAVIYADGQRWNPEAFKGNLQAHGAITSATVILARYLHGDFTPEVMHYFLMTLPALVFGVFVGFYLERRINAGLFRKIVLVMLIFVGLSLIF